MSEQHTQELRQEQQGQNEQKSLLSSRLVERALGYSWVKYGWETATKTYETVKQSNSIAKVLALSLSLPHEELLGLPLQPLIYVTPPSL
jgi:hypothetical protein